MKKLLLSLICILLSFSSVHTNPIKVKPKKILSGTSKWSGTVTYVEIVTISNAAYTAKSERHITSSFIDALPTLYRDDDATELDFTDDKGTGSHTYRSEGTFVGGRNCVTSCQSSDKAELHAVVIREEENEYDIEVVSPTCIGTSCADDGSPMPYKESQSVTISNQSLGVNKNVLTGTITKTGTIEPAIMGATYTRTTTWHLTRSTNADAELIVTPDKYDTWMPEPGRNELTEGSIMTIKLKVQGRNGRPLNVKVKELQVHLIQTSRVKGIALNYPKTPMPDQLPDLRFMLQPGAAIEDEFQVIKISGSNVTTGQVKLASYDGGGWTTLNAYAILEDDTRIKGTLLVSSGTTEIDIPKRNPGSVIAKVWADANGNPADMDDKEEKDPHAGIGDGFTAYEEYRGFFSEGRYKRFDPAKKELAVRIKITELSLFAEGISWFERASNIKVFRFLIHEVANDRRINFNSGHAHDYDQCALKLDKGNLPSDKAGKAFTTSGLPDIPANTTQVVIATANISRNYQQWKGWAQANNLRLPWTEGEYLANTVAHELGHGVKVWHHGDNAAAPQGEIVQPGSSPAYHIFDRNSNEISTRPYTISDRVCPATGSQTSGDLHCVMAYIDVCDWSRFVYADGSIGLFQSPLLAVGKNFCTGKDGTDINAGFHVVSAVSYPNYFGKAEKGKCLGQILLR